jgi:diguanylate cyclase (GGDEF)-like protein
MNSEPSFSDPLTGVYSRAFLQQRLREETERAQRYGESFSLLLVDLDHFKSINDAFGHSRGDQILVEFVHRLRSLIRASDVLFRYGGDEFVLLLPKTPHSAAFALAHRLLNEIQVEPFLGSPPLSLSLSIGVATFPEDGQNPEALFEEADLRQYEAKRQGRSQVIAHTAVPEGGLWIDSDGRLIERDTETRAVHGFFRSLANKEKGKIAISGHPGSGRSRFLSETGKIARLQGYEVINLRCIPALSMRLYGALNDALKDWNLPSPFGGIEKFEEELGALIRSRSRSGILFTVDDLIHCDWATLELFHHIFYSNYFNRLALAYTLAPDQIQRFMLPEAGLTLTIDIKPLAYKGVHVWLRNALHWEAPTRFSSWFFQETGGFPSSLKRGINLLLDMDVLKRKQEAWALDSNFSKIGLSAKLSAPPHNPPVSLPTPGAHFLGREQEIHQSKELLNKFRLVTIRGTGGVGKTRLGIQVASEIVEWFPQGVYFIPLASLSSKEFLITAIANALKFTFFSEEPPLQQLINYLSEKSLLLVLDNFEHIIDAADYISEILENAPRVKVLATSRGNLNLKGEAVIVLKGMNFPRGVEGENLEYFSSIRLFMLYARQANPLFSPAKEENRAIARICELVEGLPLGIELAAAWTSALTCQEISHEIELSMDFLESKKRDTPGRHRSLRAVFDHSWYLLSESERDAFGMLSVFQGGFTKEAATSVTGVTLVELTTYVEKSLLKKDPQGRYDIHEVLKQYAAEKLSATPSKKQHAQLLHKNYYIGFLTGLEKQIDGPSPKGALEAIDSEIDNIRCAWVLAIDLRDLQAISNSLVVLDNYYYMRGLLFEGLATFEMASDLILEDNAADITIGSHTMLPVRVLNRLGIYYSRLSLYHQAQETFQHSLRLLDPWTDSDDLPVLEEWGILYQAIGSLNDRMANFEEAREYSQKSLEIFTRMKNSCGIAESLNELGVIYYQQGDYQSAYQNNQEALKILKELGETWRMARVLINLGNISWELDEVARARNQYHESLAICREIGDKVGMAALLNNLGDMARDLREYPEAISLLQDSINICDDLGDLHGKAIALNNLGDVMIQTGELDKARALFEQSHSLVQKIGNRLSIGYTCYYLGKVAQASGREDEAWQHHWAALQAAKESQSIPLVLEVLIEIADILHKKESLELAKQILMLVVTHSASSRMAKDIAENLLLQIDPAHQFRDDNAIRKSLDEILVVLFDKEYENPKG